MAPWPVGSPWSYEYGTRILNQLRAVFDKSTRIMEKTGCTIHTAGAGVANKLAPGQWACHCADNCPSLFPECPADSTSTASALDTSAAALAAATTTVTIGTSSGFWSAIPSSPSSYSVAVGDKLHFKYNGYHNLYLMESVAKYDSCDFSGATELASTTHGGGSGSMPNLYEAVVSSAGTLYFACRVGSHCVGWGSGGQKVTITAASAGVWKFEDGPGRSWEVRVPRPQTSFAVLERRRHRLILPHDSSCALRHARFGRGQESSRRSSVTWTHATRSGRWVCARTSSWATLAPTSPR